MNKTVQKLVSGLMAVTMIFFCMPINVDALTADDKNSFAVTNPTVYVDGTTDTPVDISFYGTETDNYTFVEGQFSEKDATGKIVIQSMSAAYTTDDDNHYAETYPGYDGFFKCYDAPNSTLFEANTPIVTATYIVPGDIEPGQYKVTVTLTTSQNADKEVVSNKTYTSTITVSEPVDSSNPKFTVYYEIANSTKNEDNDTFMEFDPGAEVWVDVYVKADQTVTMQAFDIYPLWADMLTYNSITAAENIKLEISEMTAANPHFLTEFVEDGNTNMTIGTTGTKLATLKFTLNNNAVYGTHYPVYFGENTNLAREKDAESATVTYEKDAATATVGVETLKTYTVTYDANNGTWGDGVADPTQTKKHGEDLDIVPPTPNPTRTNYSFQGWSTDSGDGNTVNAPATYTANEDKTLYAVWKQNVFTVRFFDADGHEIADEKKENVQPNATVSFTGTNPTKTPTAQYEYTFKGWGDGADATTTVDLTNYPITKDTDFYPLYEAVTRKYDVIWYDDEGNQLRKDSVEYGKIPSYGSDPAKEDTAEHDYSFAGWSATKGGTVLDPLPTVDGPEAYYAIFTAEKQEYEVTYDAGEHGTLEGDTRETVKYGENPTTDPTVTPADGYTFIGWSNGTTTSDKLTDFVIEGKTTLTAQYSATNYTITLDPDNGNVTDVSWALADGKYTKGYNIKSSDKLPKPERTGFAFKGWQVVAEVGNWDISKTYSESDPLNGMYGTVELKALWDENAYNVNLDDTMQNGTVTRDPQAGSYGDPITLTPNPNEGYKYVVNTIKVTNDTNDEEVEVTANEDGTFTFNMPDSDVTVTATFTAINYTVKVTEPDNGEVSATPTTAIIGTEITLTNTPDDGYEWVSYTVTNDTTQKEITVTDGKFTMPASNVTVTATFTGKKYTIEYNANGGTGTTTSANAIFGTSATLAQNGFTKTGYEFQGWATTEDGEAVTIFNPTIYAESYTLYAVWEAKKVDVTLKHNYEGSTNGSITVTYDGTYENLTTPTRTGYDFAGWYESTAEDAAEVTKETKVAKDSAHTLYAKWDIITYTITYNENGGTEVTDGTYNVTESVTLPTAADISKNGYDFMGWYEESDANKTVVTTIDVGTTGNKTFCAIWELHTYTITFDVGNGTLETGYNNPLSYDYENAVTLPSATSNDPMYKFTGWSLATPTAGWADSSYSAGNVGESHYGDITLTAVYAPAASFKVVEYKYAYTNNYLLTVADNLNDSADSLTKTYKFDGQTMYWTDADTYKVNSNNIGTFFLLVDTTYVDVTKDDNGNVTKVELKADAYDKLKSETTAAVKINHTGDINTDGTVNIADANAVYQMVLTGGGYYSEDQLNDDERLMADMSKDKAEKHASIADVNAIVTIINNAANTVTNS